MAEKASQQAPEQQFLEIAAEIAQCNYNVRQFKKVHHSKHLKICQPQKNKIIARLSTEPNPIRHNNADVSCSSVHARTLTDGLDKTLRFNSTFIPPQNSKTKKPFFSKSATGSENFGRYRSEQKKPRAKEGNHLERYEQKWSKEKLNQRYLEGWLNSILIEYCHNEYFDHKIPNCALKKLGIDQNSLVAKGLKASHVGRLYRSLFVFGMGYNELTKEMSNGNPEVGKIIWKIYSIILEYCSKGNLETVIGDIQRQNELIVSQLAGELERKQAIIEKSEELNQRRNNQIFKEIKSLRQENINLKNEKTVLLDEHSSTEQAFAQQINLRLKFETKINQIYGLHRQLGLKHQKLYNELVKKIEQLKKESQRYFEVAGKISQYKQVQANLREQLVESKQKMNRYAQHLKEANSHSMGLSNQICNLQYEVDCLKSLYNEIRVKEKQWAIEKANMQVMVEMRQKSTKETFKEYQLTLQQNNRLYIMISDQRKTMEDYQKEKKNFNSKIISIVAENSFNKRKLEEIGRKYEETLANSNKATQKLVKLKEENEIITKIQTSSRSHFGIVEEKLNEMHRLNLVQSEQLVGLRAFQQAYNKVISQKNTQAQHLRGQAQQKSKAAQKLNVECRELQSKNAILSEKLAKTQTQLQLKQAQLIAIYDQNQQNNQHLNKTVMEQISEIQKIRNQFEIVLGQYKNQKFQRNSLNTMYIQALRTIESKNTEQRNLRVKISLIQGDYSKIKNNYSILQKSMIKLVANFSQQQQKLEQSMQQQRLLIYERQQYVHPMVVEELRTRVVDLKALEQANQQQIELLKINLQKERIFGRQQLQKSSSSFRWEINRIKVQNERALEALKNELIYAKEQWGKLKKKAEELQEVAESYRKKIFQKTTSERQQVYKYMMEQKSKQIENMLKQMQILQDQLRDSKRMLAQSAPQDPLLSVDELRNTLEQSIRRQLSHQYDLKMRETHRSVKAQYLKKQNQLKNDFENSVKEMSVEQLFKIRNVTAQQLKAMVSSRYPFQFSGQDLKEESEGRANEKRSQNQEARARNQIGRLMKNAYQYYQS